MGGNAQQSRHAHAQSGLRSRGFSVQHCGIAEAPAERLGLSINAMRRRMEAAWLEPARGRRSATARCRSPGRPDRRFGDGASYRAVANGAGMGVFSRLYLRVWRENNTAEDGIALATRRFGCPIVPVAPHP